jgi:hypothetical protein
LRIFGGNYSDHSFSRTLRAVLAASGTASRAACPENGAISVLHWKFVFVRLSIVPQKGLAGRFLGARMGAGSGEIIIKRHKKT